MSGLSPIRTFVLCLLLALPVAAQDMTDTGSLSARFVQGALRALNFYDGRIDGKMGPMTDAALRDWQRMSGFETTDELTEPQQASLIRQSAAAGFIVAREQQATQSTAGSQEQAGSNRELRLEGLKQTLHHLEERVKAMEAHSDEQQRDFDDINALIEKGIERVDALTMRVNSLNRQLETVPDMLERQWERIDDNDGRLFEMVIKIESIRQQLAQRTEARKAGAPSAAHRPGELGMIGVAGADAVQPRLLLTLMASLLIPIAVAVYYSCSGPAEVDAVRQMGRPAWVAAAWFGGGLGFYLLGAGIMLGPSQQGWLGMPDHLFVERLTGVPAALSAATLSIVLMQLILASIVSVIVGSGAQHRLSVWGHVVVALFVSGLVYPLLGHWTDAAQVQPGWLAEADFVLPAAATTIALLGGAMALALANALGALQIRSAHSPAEVDAGAAASASVMLLWVAWIGIVSATSPDGGTMPALLLSLSASAAGAALGTLVVDRLSSPESGWQRRLPFSVLAGLIAAPGGFDQASLAELMLIGLFAGLAATGLMRFLERHSSVDLNLAATLAAGGFLGTLMPALLGSSGFLFLGSFDVILPQVLGLATTLILALVAGTAVALPLRHMRVFRGST